MKNLKEIFSRKKKINKSIDVAEEFIKVSLGENKTKEEIEKELLKNEYPKEMIQEAFELNERRLKMETEYNEEIDDEDIDEDDEELEDEEIEEEVNKKNKKSKKKTEKKDLPQEEDEEVSKRQILDAFAVINNRLNNLEAKLFRMINA